MWVGDMGELIAESYLRSRKFVILRTNWKHLRGGEVDIVAREDDDLCFIEVKTRTKSTKGEGSRAVDKKKRALIRSGAALWVKALNRPDITYRYDVLEILLNPGEKPIISLYRNAFYESDFD